MGYTTTFDWILQFNKPLRKEQEEDIRKFISNDDIDLDTVETTDGIVVWIQRDWSEKTYNMRERV